MIRINLLPVRQAKVREYGRQQLVLFLVVIVLEMVVLYMVYKTKNEEVGGLNEAIAEMQQSTARVGEVEAEIGRLQADLARINNETNMVRDLEAGRVGPGAVMDDLKFIMNPPTNRAEEIAQNERGFSPTADPREVWINRLIINPQSFDMSVTALSHSAVAEFLLRLETHPRDLAGFFVRPQVSNYQTGTDPFFGEIKSLSITGAVQYQRMEL